MEALERSGASAGTADSVSSPNGSLGRGALVRGARGNRPGREHRAPGAGVGCRTVHVQLFGMGRVCVSPPGRHGAADLTAQTELLALAFVAVHRRTTLRHLAATLWPDERRAPAQRRASQVLEVLARVLRGTDGAESPFDVLVMDRGDVHLVASQHVVVDVWEFERHIETGLHWLRMGDRTIASASFRDAIRYAERPFLAGCCGLAWVDTIRDELDRARLGAAQHAHQLPQAAGVGKGEPGSVAALPCPDDALPRHRTAPNPDAWTAGSPDLRWSSLTPAERRVADAVGQGWTNREIATCLALSTRTVEAHVAHVFTKLGFHTRAQLAAEVTRRSAT